MLGAPPTTKKSTNTATIASIVFPGLGQIYNRQTSKGVILVIIGAILVYSAVRANGFGFDISVALYAFIWAYNVYDARTTAKFMNEGAA